MSEAPLLSAEDLAPQSVCQELSKLSPPQQEEFFKLRHAGQNSPPLLNDELNQAFGSKERALTKIELYAATLEREPAFSGDAMQSAIGVAIFYKNAFNMRGPDNTGSWMGYFPEAARINHSCVPNCYQSWNHNTQTICIQAIKDITADEELTIPYVRLLQPFHVRTDQLSERFGVECLCKACENDIARNITYGPRWEKFGELHEELKRVLQDGIEPPDELLNSTERLFAGEKTVKTWEFAQM